MSKKVVLKDQPSDMLTVIDSLPSDKWGKSMVLVQCKCGRVNGVRTSSLTRKASVDPKGKVRKATRSCGCLEQAAFKSYIARKASKIPVNRKVEIWAFLRQSKNWKRPVVRGHERDGLDTAARVFSIDRGTVSEVYRNIRLRFIALQKAAERRDWLSTMKSKRIELGELPDRIDCRDGEFILDGVNLSNNYVGKPSLWLWQAQEILRDWPEFVSCENPEVKEIMDLATWTIDRIYVTAARRKQRQVFAIKRKRAQNRKPAGEEALKARDHSLEEFWTKEDREAGLIE